MTGDTQTISDQTAVLTYQEVAKYLSISPMTVKRWCKQGFLKRIYLDKTRHMPRVLKSSLDELLKGGENA